MNEFSKDVTEKLLNEHIYTDNNNPPPIPEKAMGGEEEEQCPRYPKPKDILNKYIRSIEDDLAFLCNAQKEDGIDIHPFWVGFNIETKYNTEQIKEMLIQKLEMYKNAQDILNKSDL